MFRESRIDRDGVESNGGQGTFRGVRRLSRIIPLAEGEMRWAAYCYYAVAFLIVAIIAAIFGFGGVAGVAVEGAQILFWVAIVLLVISLIASVARRI